MQDRTPSPDVAQRAPAHIEPDGSVERLWVPVSNLDPSGIRLWAERVVQDFDLADATALQCEGLSTLLAAGRAQVEEVIRSR